MQPPFRIGQGFDAHAFDTNSSMSPLLIIGGVEIPYHKRIRAHSDGDVLLHAVIDALLGALALGDIGEHFPDTSKQWEKISSRILLQRIVKLIEQHNYRIGNVDTTVIAQAPKLSPLREIMRDNLAADLKISRNQVSIKASTTEKLGFIGREEGIAATATVLLYLNKSL